MDERPLFESKEPGSNCYDISGMEVPEGRFVQCGYCDVTGIQRMTVFRYSPNSAGQFLGLSSFTRIEYGPVSWSNSHLSCPGNNEELYTS